MEPPNAFGMLRVRCTGQDRYKPAARPAWAQALRVAEGVLEAQHLSSWRH